jgi:hypothetical protein
MATQQSSTCVIVKSPPTLASSYFTYSFISTAIMDAINNLSPQQRQAVMAQAQQEANAQIMREMVNKMATSCFNKCAGTSVRLNCISCIFFECFYL